MSSDVRQMPALQTASIRSPSKRRLPRIAALFPCLPKALAASAVLDGLLKPMQNVCNRCPTCRRNLFGRGCGSRVLNSNDFLEKFFQAETGVQIQLVSARWA